MKPCRIFLSIFDPRHFYAAEVTHFIILSMVSTLLCDIDFALSCMNVQAINAKISIHRNLTLNLVRFIRTTFKQYPSSYCLALEFGLIQTF